MIELKAKNWAGFYENIKSQYEEYALQLKETFDPYKQWEIKEIQILLQDIMNTYIVYLKTIGNDNGVEFLKWLETQVNLLSKMPKDTNYNAKLNIMVEAFRDFKKFRQE